jgi:hypothetical protein
MIVEIAEVIMIIRHQQIYVFVELLRTGSTTIRYELVDNYSLAK